MRSSSSSSGATRMSANEGGVGGRLVALWDVIVKCDDICFTHILPRLNRTDLKFLYEVNKETRKLVKRSSRTGDLKERFKVREMSSISTLEVAWENKSFWSVWLQDEKSFSPPNRYMLPRNFQSRYRRHLSNIKLLSQLPLARRSLNQLSRLRIHLVQEFEIRPVEFTHHMLLHDIATRAAIQQRLSEQTPQR